MVQIRDALFTDPDRWLTSAGAHFDKSYFIGYRSMFQIRDGLITDPDRWLASSGSHIVDSFFSRKTTTKVIS